MIVVHEEWSVGVARQPPTEPQVPLELADGTFESATRRDLWNFEVRTSSVRSTGS